MQILDIRSNEIPQEILYSSETAMWGGDWSRDGRLITSCNANTICLWQAETGKCLRMLEGHTRWVWDVCFSPDSTLLASSSWDETVRIWDVHSGECLRVLEGHEGWNYDLAWSPQGNLLASTSADKTVRLWNPDSGEQLACWREHTDETQDVAFSPDATRLASVSKDGSLKLWDVTAWLPKQPEPEPEDHGLRIYLSRQAATVGRLPPAPVSIEPPWVPEHLPGRIGDCLGMLGGDRNVEETDDIDKLTCCLALSTDGKHLYTGSPKGTMCAWKLDSGSLLWEQTQGHEKAIFDMALSADGMHLATASTDKTVGVWEAHTGRALQRCKGHSDCVVSVSWAPQRALIASSSLDKLVRLWDANSGECLQVLEEHQETVAAAAFSPDGERLVSASILDRTLHLWENHDWTHSKTWCSHSGSDNGIKVGKLAAVAWSPNGKYLASAETVRFNDNKRQLIVRIWDAGMKKEQQRWQIDSKTTSKGIISLSLAWSPHGDLLAAAVFCEKYDAADAEQHTTLQGKSGIYLWRVYSGELLQQFILSGTNEADTWFFNSTFRLAWSADGGFLTASYCNDRYVLWDTRRFMPAHVDEAATPLPRDLAYLATAFAGLYRLGIHPPLNVLHEVLHLLGGRPGSPALVEALAPLHKLHWPPAARIGLAAFVLRGYSRQEEWRPPILLTSARLRQKISYALVGSEIHAEPAPFSLSRLLEQAQVIDKTLVGLLKLLGPQAVAEDPGLPLYFIHRLPRIRPHIQLNRRLLSLVTNSRESGQALQRLPGGERTGLSLRGELPHLLPSQLLLPRTLLHSRYLRGELLYRVYSGKEQPRLRSTLIILDVSPPCFGPVEKITRTVAFMLADALYQAQQPVMLLAAGGNNSVHLIEKPADLLEIWTASTLQPVQVGRTLHMARMLSAALRQNSLEPLLLLLSHVHFAADETDTPTDPPLLRGLFVRYPGQKNTRPPWADCCERWVSIAPEQAEELLEKVRSLLL
ncbi:MAG: WD40 repeat domain-containing protein [Gammaproteobacteria bacterium]|nr:WD40 repeat domain-containing protein [Gammaproteobacteria bacterium]